MKLAIITAYPPSKITLNEYAYHLVKHIRQNQTITELVLLTDETIGEKHTQFKEAGCTVIVKPCWKFNAYSNIVRVTKALNTEKPDVVLFNLQFMKFGDKKVAAALGLLLPLVCKLKRIPNVVLLHNILEEVDLTTAGFTSSKWLKIAYTFIGRILTRLILQADTVTVTIPKYVNVLRQNYKVNHVKLIPHGTFEIIERPEFGTSYKVPKIMTFGKFGTYKKVEGLIEAVQRIKAKTNLELEVVIAGTDNPNTLGYLETVKKTYSHVKGITFTGYVSEHDVPKLFKESTVVVFPYTATTGSSGVLHQAGSYGKAVVMPDIGDLSLLMADEGYKGELFKPDSVDSLANAIYNIITNDAYRISLEKANYKAATAYPMNKIANMYVNTLLDCIEKKSLPTQVNPKEAIF